MIRSESYRGIKFDGRDYDSNTTKTMMDEKFY